MSVQVSLGSIHRLIRIDTFRRVHNVGFLAGQLKCVASVVELHTNKQNRFNVSALDCRQHDYT